MPTCCDFDILHRRRSPTTDVLQTALKNLRYMPTLYLLIVDCTLQCLRHEPNVRPIRKVSARVPYGRKGEQKVGSAVTESNTNCRSDCFVCFLYVDVSELYRCTLATRRI